MTTSETVMIDRNTPFDVLQQEAKKGNPNAQYYLAKHYSGKWDLLLGHLVQYETYKEQVVRFWVGLSRQNPAWTPTTKLALESIEFIKAIERTSQSMQAKEEGLTMEEITMRLQKAKEEGQIKRWEAKITAIHSEKTSKEERMIMCDGYTPITKCINDQSLRAIS